MSQRTLALLHRRLKPLVIRAMALAAPLPKETRFDGRLALSRVHWVRPELVAEVTYLSWPRTACFATPSSWLRGERGPARETRVNMRNGCHVSRAICQKNRIDRGSHST